MTISLAVADITTIDVWLRVRLSYMKSINLRLQISSIDSLFYLILAELFLRSRTGLGNSDIFFFSVSESEDSLKLNSSLRLYNSIFCKVRLFLIETTFFFRLSERSLKTHSQCCLFSSKHYSQNFNVNFTALTTCSVFNLLRFLRSISYTLEVSKNSSELIPNYSENLIELF